MVEQKYVEMQVAATICEMMKVSHDDNDPHWGKLDIRLELGN